MLLVVVVWLAALTYTVGYCAVRGYGRAVDDLTFVFGVPDWVFWGIVAPWFVCAVLSWLFGTLFVRDQDLGEELPEDESGWGT